MTKQQDTFCPAPWMTYYLEPNGKIDLCCIGSAKLGNIHEQSLDEILTSKKLIEIRQQMRDNKPVPGCEACHSGYESNLQARFVKEYGDRHHPDYQDVNSFKLKYLDLRWNNTCNYACIYCGPELSSLWAQQKNSKQIKITSMRTDLIDHVMQNLDTIEEIYLAGGEPLMLKENAQVLSELIKINPKCRIMVNTNLSQIEDNEIFYNLLEFDRVQWLISAESCGKSYEYIRWPGQWKTFDKNLRFLKNVTRGRHQICFNAVWISLNGLEIWDYFDHLLDLGFDISPSTVLPYNMDTWAGPWHLKYMPQDFLELVRKRMDDPKYHAICTYKQSVEFLEKYLNDSSDHSDVEQIKQQLDMIDGLRDLNSREYFPDIYQYLDRK